MGYIEGRGNKAVDNKKAKRKPGGGRKPSKPDYNPSAILQNQMDAAVALYSTDAPSSLQTIADELDLNPIKVRKLLITAGVYKCHGTRKVRIQCPIEKEVSQV